MSAWYRYSKIKNAIFMSFEKLTVIWYHQTLKCKWLLFLTAIPAHYYFVTIIKFRVNKTRFFVIEVNLKRDKVMLKHWNNFGLAEWNGFETSYFCTFMCGLKTIFNFYFYTHPHHSSLNTSLCWARASSLIARAWAVILTRAHRGLRNSYKYAVELLRKVCGFA